MMRTPFIGQINGVFLCHAELNILMNYARDISVKFLEEQRKVSTSLSKKQING